MTSRRQRPHQAAAPLHNGMTWFPQQSRARAAPPLLLLEAFSAVALIPLQPKQEEEEEQVDLSLEAPCRLTMPLSWTSWLRKSWI